MTTHKEALTLALEALNKWRVEWSPDFYEEKYNSDEPEENTRRTLVKSAITAIKEALAQQCVCGEPNSAGTHRTDGPCLAPQRTWVGLTQEERKYCFEGADGSMSGLLMAIESKLKEKNT